MTWIFVRLIAAVCAVLLVSGCGGGQNSGEESAGSPSPESPVITGNPAGYNSADITFATLMIKHHQQAIELAKLAGPRSANTEINGLADQIVATQQPEINILNVFLVQWDENPDIRTDGGGEAPEATGASVPGMVDDATMARLESLTGPEFDKLWLESMVGQHQGGVAIANDEIADGANVDAVSIARTIVAGLDPQIAQMKKMLEGMP
ncbi:hypothetical protein MPRF_11190 [Mycolicibacterium parafortuitum]|uniref:DUF305 domain-containing protein n=1 Tax=Mycolicibacterium parafortuitum TaxID=39692 RepID=A0A7I7TYJ7_MYCPF|nr:DUF305 domain-containing protein [Mycolicibacterium parafortuitum]BBY74220.1 hypothetical protein MPRF_11190 [Mycolicibacterium parafortuitum]